MTRSVVVVSLLACVALLAAAAWFVVDRRAPVDAPVPPAGSGPYTRVDCWFDDVPRAECAWLRPTLQDSGDATALPVVVLRRSLRARARIASVYLMGGPGGASYLDAGGIEAWTEWVRSLQLDHDFVLYDQRGTGLAQPALPCPRYLEVVREQFASSASEEQRWQELEDVLAACASRIPAGDRATLHSTATNVQDLLDLLAALRGQGYDEFVLYGASYGSRLALETAHRNAQLPADTRQPIARVVLDALYAPGIDLDLRYPRTLEEMVAQFTTYCEADDACDDAPPLEARLLAALERAERTPTTHALATGDYADTLGDVLELRVDALQLLGLLDYALSANVLVARLPDMLDEFAAGRWSDEWNSLAVEAAAGALDTGWHPLTFYLVECRDNRRYDADDYAALLQRHPRYGRWLPYLPAADDLCERLGVPALPLLAHDADVDALVVSMQLDPITPPAAARYASRRLRHAEWRLVAGAGHGAVDNDGCAARAVGRYMNRGALDHWQQCTLVESASLGRAAPQAE